MVEITITGVDETIKKLKRIGSRATAQKVIAEATHYAHEETLKGASTHHRTGTLENNISMRVHPLEGRVEIEDRGMMVSWKGRRVNYAAFVLFGARPHKIMPKNRKALRWTKGGAFAFAKSVQHPGYRGDDFIGRAADRTFERLEKIAERVIDEAG